MATVKGQNLRIFIGGKAIAAALECQMHTKLNVQDFPTKDDEGAWSSNVALNLSWDVSANGVVTLDDDRNTAASLMDSIGQAVGIELAIAGGTLNSVKQDVMLAGTAIVSDVQVTAQNRQRSTFSVQLTGTANILFPLGYILTSQGHRIVTADGHAVAAQLTT